MPAPILAELAIWFYAFGYFACYAPYSALTKALSKGAYPGMTQPLSGNSILPLSVMASMVGMGIFLTGMGWWKHASIHQVGRFNIRGPTRYTFLSGLCTAGIVMTTTLAYTFEGVSIVFVMLLMRGGVLVLAPVVDLLSRRSVRWYSYAGLGCSLAALLVAFSSDAGFTISPACALDVGIYLLCYFIRLQFMSRLAKSATGGNNSRYFVEEQMVATPMSALMLAAVALWDGNTFSHEIRLGFTQVWQSGVVWPLVLVGLLSQGTGIFGGLILLDKRENTYSVPVNRASSVLAGLLASYLLTWTLGFKPPGAAEWLGATLIVGAILFLTLPVILEKRRRNATASSPAPAR